MRVDLLTYGPEPPENNATARAGQTPAASETASNVAGEDQARFSFDQARVQSLEAQVLAQPEIRQQKVGSLQKLLTGGQYAVSAEHVAHSMIAELALVGSGMGRK